jgi:hypothetical protein
MTCKQVSIHYRPSPAPSLILQHSRLGVPTTGVSVIAFVPPMKANGGNALDSPFFILPAG